MNIGFVATEIGLQEGGAYMGGNVNNVVRLSRQLAARGHDITIITTTPRDSSTAPMEGLTWATVQEHTPRFDHGTTGYFASFLTYATRTVRKLHRQDELDVVSVHAGFPIWGAIGTAVASTTDCPVIHVQYCPLDQPSGRQLLDLVHRPRWSRWYLSGADELVGISPDVSDSLARVTGRESIRTIYPAIDTAEYAPINGDDQDVPLISYLGSLDRQKGLDLLVDAFERTRETHPCRLALGLEARSNRADDPLLERIQDDPDIEVNGIIDDVPGFLANSDVFVVPFRTTMGPADYPVAALEAMSCGVPIIATDVGGIKRLVSNSGGGICVCEPSVESLVSGLSTLLSDSSTRMELGNAARSFVEQSCAVDAVTKQFESVVRSSD